MERTFVMLKPDCVQRRLTGRVMARFEDKGLNFIAMKMLRISPELSKKHYAEHVNKPFYPLLEEFITTGPVVALVAEGPQAVAVVRAMTEDDVEFDHEDYDRDRFPIWREWAAGAAQVPSRAIAEAQVASPPRSAGS